ncbi:MAG TPA: serine/threonine-protein kinase [Kofleriaceae bacterium]|nr:serine/threonine-protein kinase [Kofleriaceae bacterium]
MAGDGSDDELARTATAVGANSPGKDAATPTLGGMLGRYRLERELGAGGMGVVHAAFDPDLERRVALKVLRSEGGEARQRLLREARALARLTHPNVVTVHEVGSASGRDYVAMELIEGETLAEWLKAAPRTLDEIVNAFIAAARGLAAAHAANLVHRDFKPHNVLRRKDGRIVVTDFGLARGIEAIEFETTMRAKGPQPADDNTPSPLTGLTQTGSVLGTPAYMAPEQWSGDTVGPAADQFAYCVAVWEALAGERPFKGATLEALQADVERGPSQVDDSKLPRRMRAALKRGLDPDPKRRWPSMDALIGALGRADKSRSTLLMIGSFAVVATAAAYAVFATDDKKQVAAPTCEQPVLEPAAIWSPAIANEVRDKTSSDVMRRFDAVFGAWQSARGVACGLDTPMRSRRLACLDGVIVRIDAVRKASVAGVKPSLDEVSEQLVDPEVCNVDDPPRLPTRLGEAAVTALALAYQPDPKAEWDDKAETEALRKAGDDRCARALIRIAHATNDKSTNARDAAEEAVGLADSCGDDRMRADAQVELLAMQVTMFLDPKLQKALATTEAAVRKVSQPDLVAQLDLVKAEIAMESNQWDECIKLADSAIRGFGQNRPLARLEAVQTKARALSGRRQPGDLKTARGELARWRAEAEKVGQPRVLANFDALDVLAQWSMGDVAGANARYAALYDQIEKSRRKPPEGDPMDGTVVDATGKPVADAVVAAGAAIAADSQTIGYFGNFGDARIAKTDAQGRFTIDHVPKDAIIVAQSGELRSRVKPAKPNDRLVLEPTVTVTGKYDGPNAAQLMVFIVNADRDRSPMYQMLAPIASDGSFTLSGVPVGHLRIGAVQAGTGGRQSFAMQDITTGPKGLSDVIVKRADSRKVRVIVRSSAVVPLSGAQVFIVAGAISIKTVKEIESVLRSPGMAIEVARPISGETPPDLGKVVAGDLLATFNSAPTGVATACAIGLSGDFSDPGFREKVQRHIDELEVRCVPLAPDTKAATIEVPPMKRLD